MLSGTTALNPIGGLMNTVVDIQVVRNLKRFTDGMNKMRGELQKLTSPLQDIATTMRALRNAYPVVKQPKPHLRVVK